MQLGNYLCQRLFEAGVLDLFAVPGDFNLGLFDKFIDSKINYIGCCNELNAAYAADGYARVKGIGAVASTYAVGELSAINAVAGSYAESVPVVSIVGCPKVEFYNSRPLIHHTLGDYDIPQQMYAKVTGAQTLLTDPKTAAAEIDRVIKHCLMFKTPVYIGVPSDMVEKDIVLTESVVFQKPELPKSDPEVLAECVEDICSKLAKSSRPVFLPGVELIRRNLGSVFEELTDATNIPYVTMLLSKSVIPELHPHFIGLYSGARSRPEVQDTVNSSDCVVILGEKLTDFNTGGFTFDVNRKNLINVGFDSVRVSSHIYTGVYIHELMAELVKKVTPFPEPAYDYPTAKVGCVNRKDSIVSISETEDLTMADSFRRIARFIPDRAVVIAETGSSMFATAETMLPDEAIYIGQTFYGSIGYTVGATLGASVACKSEEDRRVVLFIGDGSFQVTCQDLSTMIRYGCNPVIFLINNDGYTIERVITDNVYNDIQMWQYSQLPLVFGAKKAGTVVKTMGDLTNALAQAEEDSDELAFIEVILDRWDCNDLLKNAGRMMAKNNNLKSSLPPVEN